MSAIRFHCVNGDSVVGVGKTTKMLREVLWEAAEPGEARCIRVVGTTDKHRKQLFQTFTQIVKEEGFFDDLFLTCEVEAKPLSGVPLFVCVGGCTVGFVTMADAEHPPGYAQYKDVWDHFAMECTEMMW